MQKRLITLVMAIILAFGAAAFAETADTAAQPDASTVLATVNGTDITLGDISGAYQYLASMYQSYGMDTSTADVQQALSSYALNMLIQERVLQAKAKELGFDKFSEEEEAAFKTQAETTYENTLTSYKSYFAAAGLTEDEVRKNTIEYFDTQGYTVDSIVKSLESSAANEKVYNDAVKDAVVSDEEAKKIYDEGLTPRYVKHILVKVADAKELKRLKSQMETLKEGDENYQTTVDRIAEIMKDVQPKLDEIAAKIEAGEEFQALIDQYGEDGGMKSGESAEIGYAMYDGNTRYVTEFTNAGMALVNVGDISEPVLSDYGFHIIRYESEIPFEEAIIEIKASLESTKKSEAYNAALSGWIQSAEIVYAQQPATEAE